MAGAQGAKGKKMEQGELWVRGAGRPDQAGPSPRVVHFQNRKSCRD